MAARVEMLKNLMLDRCPSPRNKQIDFNLFGEKIQGKASYHYQEKERNSKAKSSIKESI
jgi:hypothetical protein